MSSYRMPFGKHRGELLSKLPDSYLLWLHELDLREPLKSKVEIEFERRGLEENDQAAILPAELLKMANDVVSAGFRALAVKHHPDHGGDHHAMTWLNRAVEFLRKGLERAA